MIVNGSSRRMYVMRRLAGILSTLHPLLSSRGIFSFSTRQSFYLFLNKAINLTRDSTG